MTQYSEHGEDTFLFDWIAKNRPNINRLIVDIGAYDGQFFSNSCAFIESGWRGVLVEPHPESFVMLREKYGNNENVVCLNAAILNERGTYYLSKEQHPTHTKIIDIETELSVEAIEYKQLMYEYFIDIKVGILSIDAEGCDTEILRDVLRYELPDIIIIEANTVKDRSEQIKLLSVKYDLISTMDVNTIWAKKQ